MFVRQSTYDHAVGLATFWERRHAALLREWNALVTKINEKGGSAFLKGGQLQAPPALTDEDIKRLLMLCHPDKHDGKPMAVDMTAKLLAMRSAS